MDPILLGILVGLSTIVVLFSGISVAVGLLVVSAVFLFFNSGTRDLALMPELLFGKLMKGGVVKVGVKGGELDLKLEGPDKPRLSGNKPPLLTAD